MIQRDDPAGFDAARQRRRLVVLSCGPRSKRIDAAGGRHVAYQTPGGRVIKDAFVLSAGFGDVFDDTPQQNGVVNVASNQLQ